MKVPFIDFIQNMSQASSMCLSEDKSANLEKNGLFLTYSFTNFSMITICAYFRFDRITYVETHILQIGQDIHVQTCPDLSKLV